MGRHTINIITINNMSLITHVSYIIRYYFSFNRGTEQQMDRETTDTKKLLFYIQVQSVAKCSQGVRIVIAKAQLV